MRAMCKENPNCRTCLDTFPDMPFDICPTRKLAAYEDTGLSPAEVAELAQAKADGRVVVLPVSVGDTVYVDKGVTVKSAEGWRTKRILFVGKVVSFRKNGNGVFLKIRFSFMEGSKSYMRSYVVSAIGKTIFLTREEAEKALKERDNNV